MPENLDAFEPLPGRHRRGSAGRPLDLFAARRNRAARQRAHRKIPLSRGREPALSFLLGRFLRLVHRAQKADFQEDTGLTNEWKNMLAALERALRLLHPLMPFITEELWQRLTVNTPGRANSIALTSYPQPKAGRRDLEAESAIGVLQEVVSAVRNLRAEMNIPPREPLQGTLFSPQRGCARRGRDASRRLRPPGGRQAGDRRGPRARGRRAAPQPGLRPRRRAARRAEEGPPGQAPETARTDREGSQRRRASSSATRPFSPRPPRPSWLRSAKSSPTTNRKSSASEKRWLACRDTACRVRAPYEPLASSRNP